MTKNEKIIRFRWIFIRMALLIFDVLAVNVSFLLAIYVRFYVANEFYVLANQYFVAFWSFAPFYTIICIVLFYIFKLYSGIWRYAGFNDLNRIIAANALALVFHVAGTLLFTMRMPITYYVIGTIIQFTLIAMSRFSFRLLVFESDKFKKEKNQTNTMIIGRGSTIRLVLKELETQETMNTACIVNYANTSLGNFLDGIPVINGIDNIKDCIAKYKISNVVIASTSMEKETREKIKSICKECDLEVLDYSGFFQRNSVGLHLRSLAPYIHEEVELIVNGKYTKYEDIEQALNNEAGNDVVKSISAKNNVLVIELGENTVIQNDTNESWVKEVEQETGQEISFF